MVTDSGEQLSLFTDEAEEASKPPTPPRKVFFRKPQRESRWSVERVAGCRRVCYFGHPVQHTFLYAETYRTLMAHQLRTLDERRILEAIIFSMGTQIQKSERIFEHLRRSNDATMEQLLDVDWHLSQPNQPFVQNGDVRPRNRLAALIERVKSYDGTLVQMAEDYLANPKVFRKYLTEWPGVGIKTASMFYLMLGGVADLMTLDRHVNQALYQLGIPMKEEVGNPQPRQNGIHAGRVIPWGHSTDKEYERVEAEALDMLAELEAIPVLESGKPNATFATTLLWLSGVRRSRYKEEPDRGRLLDEHGKILVVPPPLFLYPFSDGTDSAISVDEQIDYRPR